MSSVARALALGALLCVLGWTGSAHASTSPSPLIVEDEALPSLALLYTAVPMFVLDLVLLGIDRPLPPALAILEIAVVGLLIPIGVLATVEQAGFERPERQMLTGMAIASLVLFPAHGIYSIWRYEALQKEKRADARWRGDAAVRSLTES